MEYLFLSFVFILGLLVGSFLNVVTLRFGFSEGTRSRSQCQACLKTLSWYELVPLVSYVLLRGKCSSCESKISIQYPLVELLTGALFAATYTLFAPIQTFLSIVPLVLLCIFWAAFIALLVYDIRHTLVPLHFALPLIVVALALRAYEAFVLGSYAPLFDAVSGAVVVGGFIALIVLVTRGRGMGAGDIYVATSLGVLFGFARGIEVLMLAFWIGAVVGVLLLAFKKSVTMKYEVPFVPFLFVASALGLYTRISPFDMVNTITRLWF